MKNRGRRTTCQWCNQRVRALITVCRPVPGGAHMDGPFIICVGRCLGLAEHFGYSTIPERTETVAT